MTDILREISTWSPEARWTIAICVLVATMLSVVLSWGNEPSNKKGEPVIWWTIFLGVPVVFVLVLLGSKL